MSESRSDDKTLFSPMVLGFLVASVVAIFALSVLLSTIGSGEDTPFGATTGSPSAIGHRGFYALMERLGRPVSRSRANEPSTIGRGGLLIVAEPRRNLMDFRKDRDLSRARDLLLILPKWTGAQDVFHDGWVRDVSLLGLDQPRRVVELFDSKAGVTREKPSSKWALNTIGIDPVLEGDVQLVSSKVLKPLIGTADKMLLGERVTKNRQRIWVLADPDPIENHGIATPANTRFAIALVDKLQSGNGPIVFDELVHGVVAPQRNPLQLLFQFPFVIVTLQILVALALLLLATMSRFGGAETVPPPFTHGKTQLIDNIASLLDRAGHQAVVLRRYIAVKLMEAGRTLHAPAGLDERATAKWLDRVGTARGIDPQATAIFERSGAAGGRRSRLLLRLFEEARHIHRWNKDLMDGSGRRQGDR